MSTAINPSLPDLDRPAADKQRPESQKRTTVTRHPFVVPGVVLGLAAAVVLMLLAFVTPAVNSGPDQLPIGVGGPPAATSRIQQALEQKQPGAFDVKSYADAAALETAIKNRDIVGGITVTRQGVTIQTASAAGTPYPTLLKAVGAGLQAQGQQVTYADVVPLSKDDSTGAGLTALGLPLAFGGMASAVILSNVLKGGTHRSRMLTRIAASFAFAILGGAAAAAVLRFFSGTFSENYWMIAGAFAMGIAAISLFVLGLEARIGYVGLGIGGLLMMFVSNPLSGMATGAAWLPHPWGTIGQLMPIGAAGTAIRSAGFFDGHGMARPLIVLTCWIVVGILLTVLAVIHKERVDARG